MKKISLGFILTFQMLFAFAQSYTIVLGKPTNNSITISALFSLPVEVSVEYGPDASNLINTSASYITRIDTPIEINLTGLNAYTEYFYRLKYKLYNIPSQTNYSNFNHFRTNRSLNESFSFAVEADPHLDTNTIYASYTLTLQNMLANKHDFLIDLGDNFMSEKLPVINQTEITARHLLYRNYFNEACPSTPLYLVLGNHEGELGWRTNDTGINSLSTMSANTRNLYYPNPSPNAFYSGNNSIEKYVGFRRNYYAWEWGNALFVVIDPYWYTKKKPGWGWTLGKEQYDWFKNTISSSNVKYKFVFSHQLVGGDGNEGRGGTEFAHLYENGGYNLDSTFGFNTNRPNWGKSIHQLMVDNHVNIFFHGHDHFYGKQIKDGVIYQEVPQPSAKNINSTNLPAAYGYKDGVFLGNRGYISVKINQDSAKVDYVKTFLPNEENTSRKNNTVAYSYAINTSTGINVKGNNFTAYPNPANQILQIQSTENNSEFNIIDLLGNCVVKTSSNLINTEFIPEGIYTLIVKNKANVRYQRIVIQH